MKKGLSLLICAVLLAPSFGFAGILHWPMLGGTPVHEGIASSIPEPPLEILWQTKLGMPTLSAPLTDGEKIYVAGGRYAGNEGGFFCLDYLTGKILWPHSLKGAISSTPVISGGKIIGACSDGLIYGRDLNGAEVYGAIADGKGSRSSGVDNAQSVFFGLEGSSHNLVSIDAYSGTLNWKSYISSDIQISPCAYGGSIYAPAEDGLLYAVNDTTGDVNWIFEIGAKPAQSPMIINENIIIPTEIGISAIHLAIDKEDVELMWSKTYMGKISTMPCTDGNMIYFGAENGKLYCFEPDNGNMEWSYDAKSKITCSPVSALGKVVFGSEDGNVYIFDSSDKQVTFKVKLPSVPVAQPLALWDRIIVSCSDGTIVCIGVPNDEPNPPNPPEPPNPPDPPKPDPPPEPPKEEQHIQPVIKILAPTEAIVDDKVAISLELSNAKLVKSLEFMLGFDSLKAEYVSFKSGSLKDDAGLELIVSETKKDGDVFFKISSEKGISANGIILEFSLKINEPGTHRVSLIDSKATFTDGKSLDPQIITASFDVKQKKPMVELSLTAPEIDLGTAYAVKKVKLRLSQRNGEEANFIVRTSSESCIPNVSSGKIGGNNALDIEISVDPSKLKPGKYEVVISVNIIGQTLKSVIKFIVPEPSISEPPPCIEIEPASLDFGYIPRGKEISLEFVLNFNTDKEVSGVIKPDKNWLKVSPATFKTKSGIVTGIATISASELPGGSDFIGKLVISAKDKVCRDVIVEAKVQTQPSIVLELDIGVKKAKIGSMTVDLDQYPRIKPGNRTVVPIRFISESFGCQVQWEAQTKKVTITRFNDTIVLWIGKKEAIVNGKKVVLDVAPVIEDNGTLVPIRFISQAFGAKVEWFHETKHITITYTPPQNDYVYLYSKGAFSLAAMPFASSRLNSLTDCLNVQMS